MFRLTQEQLEESSFYQMILEKGTEVGRVEGRVEGLEVGLVEGTRRAVRLVAGLRFPALGNLPELGGIIPASSERPKLQREEWIAAQKIEQMDRSFDVEILAEARPGIDLRRRLEDGGSRDYAGMVNTEPRFAKDLCL